MFFVPRLHAAPQKNIYIYIYLPLLSLPPPPLYFVSIAPYPHRGELGQLGVGPLHVHDGVVAVGCHDADAVDVLADSVGHVTLPLFGEAVANGPNLHPPPTSGNIESKDARMGFDTLGGGKASRGAIIRHEKSRQKPPFLRRTFYFEEKYLTKTGFYGSIKLREK